MEAFLRGLIRAGRSPRTVEGYRKDLRDFVAWVEGRYGKRFDPRTTLPEDMRDYRQHLLTVRKAAPSTVNRGLAAIRSFFAFLVATQAVSTNPATGINGVKMVRPAPRALSDGELRRLLQEAGRSSSPLHRRWCFSLPTPG